MEGLLTPVSTAYKNSQEAPEEILVEVKQTISTPAPETHRSLRSPDTLEGTLDILRHQPDFETLSSILQSLAFPNSLFDIKSPSPIAAQLVNVLVTEIIPSYWSILKSQISKSNKNPKTSGKKQERDLLLNSLRSVTGLNAILGRIRALIQEEKTSKKTIGGSIKAGTLRDLINVIQEILKPDTAIHGFYSEIQRIVGNASQQTALWQEFVALIGGGKILSNTAEAVTIINESSNKIEVDYWIADGALYCGWLGQQFCQWTRQIPMNNAAAWKNCSSLISKSFRLGHTDKIVLEIVSGLMLREDQSISSLQALLSYLPTYDQKTFILCCIKFIAHNHLSNSISDSDSDSDSRWWKADSDRVGAAAGLLDILIADQESRKTVLTNWLTNASGAGTGELIGIRRAVLAALSKDRHAMENVLEKSMQQFGDQLYIKHTPVLQQEVHTQVLLLAAGYVYRTSPMRLSMIMRSGNYLGAISNRLAASSVRARILGMIVGEALSGFEDKIGSQMSFKMEETETSEAKWYKSLAAVQDSIGQLSPLISRAVVKKPKKVSAAKAQPQKSLHPSNSKIVAIEELSDSNDDDGDDEDDSLTYAKPDSDDEDSDEDATLVTRNKPTAPVYIRDLITYIRNTDSYDHQLLALTTAPSLIRRKANFGTELTSHSTELATLLVGLQDKYDISNFQDLRLQSLISLVTSVPTLGPWFSKTFFDGDYSISQRASILTVLGLSARELGGFGSQDASLSSNKPSAHTTSFPSKTLPAKMHAIYADADPVSQLTSTLASTMLQPLAASAADKLTGPNVLKTRTFSSRLAVEARRSKPIPNALAALVASNFFFPLTGRFAAHLRAYGAGNVVFSPNLLSTFLKTLAIILHASGPATMSLPQMTSEYLDLLLGVRGQGGGDVLVVEAVLFGVLTVLELHAEAAGRTLAETHARELVEVQGWTEGVFGRLGGGSEEDERVRSLAAGVLMRIAEVTEKYQRLLVGELGGF